MQAYVTIPVTLVTSLQRKFHLRVAEWLTAAITITMGGALSAFPRMFATSDYLSEMARFAPQSVWATALLIIGFARASALFINGAWRHSPHLRVLLAILSIFAWCKILDGFVHLERPSLALAIYPWLALADFYAVFRAAGDARLADEQAKAFSKSR